MGFRKQLADSGRSFGRDSDGKLHLFVFFGDSVLVWLLEEVGEGA